MFRKLFGLGVCISTLSMGALSSFMYFKYQDDKIKNSLNSKDNTTIYELSPSEKFLTNLLKSSIKCNSLDASIKGIEENKDLGINFKGVVEYDSSKLMSGDFSGLKLNGALKVNYGSLNEEATAIFDDKLYIGYNDNYYSFDTSIFTNIISLVSLFNNENEEKNIESAENSLNLDDLLNNITSYLNDIKEVETGDDNTYKFNLTIPNLGSINFDANKDFLLTGIDGNLSINGIDINLLATGVSQSVTDSYFEGVNNQNKYTNTDNLSNLLVTLTNIINDKKGSGNFTASINNLNTNEKIEFNGDLLVDYSNANNIKEGKFELNINSNLLSNTNNSLKAHYENNSTYFILNKLIKGYVSNTSIEEIIDVLKEKTNLFIELNLLDKVNEVLANSAIMDLIKNKDFNKIHDIIVDFIVDNDLNTIEIDLNNKAFNLTENDSILKIIFKFNENKLISLSLNNLCYNGYSANFTLNLNNELNYNESFNDLTNFKDYSNVSNIFNNIMELAESKKANLDYNVKIVNKNNANSSNYISGKIGVDLSKANLNENFDLNELTNGNYLFTISNISGVNHDIKANYYNKSLYLKYNDLIKNSVSENAYNHLFDFINEKMNNSEDFNIASLITKYTDEFLTRYESQISEIKKGNVAELDNYFKIDEDNLDPNVIKINIYPNSLDLTCVYEFSISTVDKKINNLSIKGINVNDYIFDISLNLLDYEDISLSSEEISSYYSLDNFESSLTSFLNNENKQYGINLNGTIYTGNKLYINGNLNADLKNENYFGNLTLDGQLDGIDKDRYIHKFKVDKFKNENTDEKDFYINYNDKMYINMHLNTINDLINQFNNIPEKNVLNYLFKLNKTLSGELPIQQILNNKDYFALLNNNYLKSFKTLNGLISLTIDGSLLDLENDLSLTINYDENNKVINSIQLDLLNKENSDEKIASIKLDFVEFDNNELNNRVHIIDKDKTFFDFDNLKLLFMCGIYTTNIPTGQDTITYYLKGKFDLDVPTIGNAIQSDIYQDLMFKIQVLETGKVNGYICLEATDENHNVYSGKNTKVRQTEYFINDDGSAYIHQKTVSKTGFIKYTYTQNDEYFKVTAEEITKNIVYYLLKYTLNVSSTIYDPIEEAINTPNTSGEPNEVLNVKYESIFTKMEYDSNEKCFSTILDLNNVVNLENATANFVYQGNLNIDIYHDENNILKRFHLYGKPIGVKIVGDITLDLDVTNYYNDVNASNMNEYNNFIKYWNSNENLSKLDYYQYRVNDNKISFTTSL